jgi:hypothetical protein
VAPLLHANQWLAGPLVNAILLMAAVLTGQSSALMLAMVPSTFALARGILPIPVAPIVPFIAIGNGIYIVLFNKLYKKSYLLALFAGSLLKAVFLYAVTMLVMPSLLAAPLIEKLSLSMSWPQFVTATTGGMLAFILLKKMKKL